MPRMTLKDLINKNFMFLCLMFPSKLIKEILFQTISILKYFYVSISQISIPVYNSVK